MRINSKNLYEYVNNLNANDTVKFKVYYDDNYYTDVYWNGMNFEWITGTFGSGAFFNPLYDFEPIEEKKEIEKIPIPKIDSVKNERILRTERKINEIIDEIKKLKEN